MFSIDEKLEKSRHKLKLVAESAFSPKKISNLNHLKFKVAFLFCDTISFCCILINNQCTEVCKVSGAKWVRVIGGLNLLNTN